MSAYVHQIIQQIIAFAGAHPALVGLVLCFFAGGEAILIVGALLPGEAVVLGVAAAAGAAGVDPWSMVLWTMLGAAIGDGISFWIGHTQGHAVARWPWLRSRPELLEKGEQFIERHGVKSVIIARFLPALRAIVPVAAGILGMEPKRFYFANVVSALGWALIHILPAAALGMAYSTLGEVSGRIALLVALLLLLVFLAFWILRLVVYWLTPHVLRLHALAITMLGRRSDRVSRMLARLLDPGRPGFAGLAFWSFVLLVAVMGFMALLEDLLSGDPLVRADIAINHLVQGLRTEPVDAFMVIVTSMGDSAPLLAAAGALIGILLLQRAWRTALAASAVIAIAGMFVTLLKLILHKPRPIRIFSGAEAYSFPSAHTALTAVIFGVLAVVVSRGLSGRARMAVLSLAILWIGLVGASRIYLSAHWPSDVLGGMLFGVALTAAFALLLDRIDPRKTSRSLVGAGVLAAFLSVGSYHAVSSFESNLERYAPRIVWRQIPFVHWASEGWRLLPARRIDLGGEHEEPLVIQWAAEAQAISRIMVRAGWRKARTFTWRDGLMLLSPGARLADLAPLPTLHDGRVPLLTLIRDVDTDGALANERLVLRLWRSDVIVTDDKRRIGLLVGSVMREVLVHPVSWIALLREMEPPAGSLRDLEAFIRDNKELQVRKIAPAGPLLVWMRPTP